jgi:SAM-dependent methyltransferase
MPFKVDELQKAYLAYQQFKARNPLPYHERYIFPFFAGSYFAYRKIDVMRIAQVAKSISDKPNYVDIGCGYGDFLRKVREFLPSAVGIEKDGAIFYILQKPRPDYIYSSAIEWFFEAKTFDVAFVGWMEPGVDFRQFVARSAKCIVTTFDAGGQCGINGGCEYDQYGFEKIAWWRTPSWIDVNTELMNKFYTPSSIIDENKKQELAKIRTAHNFWYLYARPEITDEVIASLNSWLEKEEEEELFSKVKFDFESILDECGFHYKEELPAILSKDKKLWEVRFD